MAQRQDHAATHAKKINHIGKREHERNKNKDKNKNKIMQHRIDWSFPSRGEEPSQPMRLGAKDEPALKDYVMIRGERMYRIESCDRI